LSEEQTVPTVRMFYLRICIYIDKNICLISRSFHFSFFIFLFVCKFQILRRPSIGAGYRVIDMITEPFRLIRRCEVTAILVLYGLPRYPSDTIYFFSRLNPLIWENDPCNLKFGRKVSKVPNDCCNHDSNSGSLKQSVLN